MSKLYQNTIKIPLDILLILFYSKINMSSQYNFYNLEAEFKKYLLSGNKSLTKITIKNYLSDLRHFFGWFIRKFKNIQIPEDFKKIDEKIIEEYKNYLIVNGLPLKTINRRLSTLRKFGSFCISQNWLSLNPAKKINNLSSGYQQLNEEVKKFRSLLNSEDQKNLDQFISFLNQ